MKGRRLDVFSTLKQVDIFSSLSEQQLAFVRSRVVQREYGAGELVFSEGEPCTGLFVVQSGAVRIFKNSPSGREHTLEIQNSGCSIAELPVFDGGPYPASAQAITESSLLFFSKQDFRTMCLQDPEVALKVLSMVGSRLRRLVGIIEELSFTTVRHRLAALLLRLAKTEGEKTSEGVQFTLRATNQDLAAQIGTVRELVSRNMSRFQSEGLLRQKGRTIMIPSVAKLAAELRESE